MIFKNPHAYLQFVCCTASQPAVSPGSDGCGASRITLNNSLLRPIYENCILKTIIPMRYGNSFLSFLPTNIRKQLTSQQHSIQGDSYSINTRLSISMRHLFGLDHYHYLVVY